MGEGFEVEHLRAGVGEMLQQAALTAARRAADDAEREARGQVIEIGEHRPPERAYPPSSCRACQPTRPRMWVIAPLRLPPRQQ